MVHCDLNERLTYTESKKSLSVEFRSHLSLRIVSGVIRNWCEE